MQNSFPSNPITYRAQLEAQKAAFLQARKEAAERAGLDPRLADLVYVKQREGREFRAGTLNPYTGAPLSSPIDPNQTFTGI